MSKDKNKKDIKQDQPKVDEAKKQENKESKPKIDPKFEELYKVIDNLKNENANLLTKLASYEKQVADLNADYVKKISEKAKQANEILTKEIEQTKAKLTEEYNKKALFSSEKIATEIVDVVNHFESALAYTPTDPKIANYQKGFVMFLNMLKGVLSNIGVSEILVNINDEFNPALMECFETNNSNEIANNHVIKVIKKGYKLYDRVISPTLVVVCKKTN